MRNISLAILAFALAIALPARSEILSELRSDTTREDYEALDAYIGRWISDEKASPNGGEPFTFEIELAYYDEAQTIIELRIHQAFPGGERSLWWHGYKGWNPVDKETYYHGFSPMGRVSAGKVVDTGQAVITIYDAFDSRGQAVQLRDEFGPVENGEFASVSYLRPAGEEEWRVIARDTWRRID